MAERDIPILDDRLEEDSVTLSTQIDSAMMSSFFEKKVELDPNLSRLMMFSWEFSPAVQVVSTETKNLHGLTDAIMACVPAQLKVVRITAPLKSEMGDLVGELAAEWDVALTRGRAIDLSVLLNRMQRSRDGSLGYFLLLENAHELSDEHWELMRNLAQAESGLVKLLLVGQPQLIERCERYLGVFGVECRLIDIDELGLTSSHKPDPIQQLSLTEQRSSSQPLKILLVAVMLLGLIGVVVTQKTDIPWLTGGQDGADVSLQSPIGNFGEQNSASIKELEVTSVATVTEVTVADAPKKNETDQVVDDAMALEQAIPIDGVTRVNVPAEVIENQLVVPESSQPQLPADEVAIEPAEIVKPIESGEPSRRPVEEVSGLVELKEGLRSDKWVLAQDPATFTLHLMSVRSEQRLRELIVDNGWQEKASYYLAHRKSGEWYVLLYGQYESVKAAEQDKVTLSKQLKVKDALVKKYDIFQRDISSRAVP